jgi:hypothetical protein
MQYTADSGASSAIALLAATTKTVLMVIAPSTAGGQAIELGVTFDGVTAANTPAYVEVLKCSLATNSTPGTGNTSITPTQERGDGNTSGVGLASLFTALGGCTSEPTVLTHVKGWNISPTSGVLTQIPLGREVAIIPSMGLAVRITAPQAVNVRPYLTYIIGPS